MTKFVLDTGVISGKVDEILSLSDKMNDILTTVSSFSVNDADGFDFASAFNSLKGNIESTDLKIRRTAEIFNTVLETHSNLQNSYLFDVDNVISNNNPVNSVGESEVKVNPVESLTGGGNGKVQTNVNSQTANDNVGINKKQNISIEENNQTSTFNSAVNTTSYLNRGNFIITTDNKKYTLSQEDKELLMAIVASEAYNGSVDDCLAVISVILNRCENQAWINSHGTDPISQVKAPGQFAVYASGAYTKYLNGNVPETVMIAVNDALNGVRNNSYLSFRSNDSTSYSNNLVHERGNRYK